MSSILSSSRSSRIESLRNKHAALSGKIEEAQSSPSTANYYLTQLKRQKLLLKEEIESLRAERKGRAA